MKITKILEIMKKFKDLCSGRGWRTSDANDWVAMDDTYHNFLWAKDVPVSSFRRITSEHKCIVKEGLSYMVVDAAYTAWLFSVSPSENLIKTFLDKPEFSNNVALYDLSPIFDGKNVCARLNQTDSPIFKEFESFLRKELKVKIHELPTLIGSKDKTSNFTVAEVA